MTKVMRKIIPKQKGERILSLYKMYKIRQFPEILNFHYLKDSIEIEFEFIEGRPLIEDEIQFAFFELGKIHSENIVEKMEAGFRTICHGDFHLKNMLKTFDGIRFIDMTYIKQDWNYSDLDYVDFFNLYAPDKYPWMIKNPNILNSYHNGLGIILNQETNEEIKRLITIYALKNSIKNAIQNGINCEWEKSTLKLFNRVPGLDM